MWIIFKLVVNVPSDVDGSGGIVDDFAAISLCNHKSSPHYIRNSFEKDVSRTRWRRKSAANERSTEIQLSVECTSDRLCLSSCCCYK